MATKAIYTKIDDTYYRVNQDTEIPTNVFSMPGTHSNMTVDPLSQKVNSKLWINTISKSTVSTNKELYENMIEDININKVKSIQQITDRYLIYLDYCVYNKDDKEITHSVAIKELNVKDSVYLLGVNSDGDLMYKRIKELIGDMSFVVKNEYPMGIMYTNTDQYKLIINDLIVYQDLNETHRSSENVCYAVGSHTITSTIAGLKKIYSTADNSISIAAVEVPFIPREISLRIHIALDNIIVVYDDAEISDIVINNIIEEKTNCNCDKDNNDDDNNTDDDADNDF